MNRLAPLLVVLAVTIGAVAVPAVGAPADVAPDDATSAQTNETVAPGARFAGVVDVQEAEVGGELAERAFGLRLARARSNGSKAAVVATEVRTLRDQLAALEQRRDRLTAARRNGTMSEARYRAEVAGLLARSRVLERQINRTHMAAGPLPADVLVDRGVNVSAIDRLRTGARNLTGPEVARIARSIGGPRIGAGLVDRGPDEIGPPEDRPAAPGPPDDSDRPGPPDDHPRGDDGPDRRGPPTATDDPDGDNPVNETRTAEDEPADGTDADADGASPSDEAGTGPPADAPAGPGRSDDDQGAGESPGGEGNER